MRQAMPPQGSEEYDLLVRMNSLHTQLTYASRHTPEYQRLEELILELSRPFVILTDTNAKPPPKTDRHRSNRSARNKCESTISRNR